MSTRSKSHHHQQQRRELPPAPSQRRFSWCCSFSEPPENPTTVTPLSSSKKIDVLPSNSIPTSPQSQGGGGGGGGGSSSKIGLVTRRILSPGRVSPIEETTQTQTPSPPPIPRPSPPLPKHPLLKPENSVRNDGNFGIFDVRLNLKGKNGTGSLILELNSEVLIANSVVFADLIANYRKNLGGLCRIEVPDVENLIIFRETIQLMFEENEEDITKKLLNIGVYRSIDILEVSTGIKFTRGVSSCLNYLEAMPWTEEEEEKLKTLLTKSKFDYSIAKDIMVRLETETLYSIDTHHTLTKHLISSITMSIDTNARTELKSLVKKLLTKSIKKEDIYSVYESCLRSLITLIQQSIPISYQVDNIIWLFDILIDHQIAEEFINKWGNETELLKSHEKASPMIRYELSRVSAMIFIAMGSRKIHCKSEIRLRVIQAWFRPMLLDFGWLQRCKKGLDIKALEEFMGQVLLTLPLKDQHILFMDWVQCFSKCGTECPNLGKAFQIWWRRSFIHRV